MEVRAVFQPLPSLDEGEKGGEGPDQGGMQEASNSSSPSLTSSNFSSSSLLAPAPAPAPASLPLYLQGSIRAFYCVLNNEENKEENNKKAGIKRGRDSGNEQEEDDDEEMMNNHPPHKKKKGKEIEKKMEKEGFALDILLHTRQEEKHGDEGNHSCMTKSASTTSCTRVINHHHHHGVQHEKKDDAGVDENKNGQCLAVIEFRWTSCHLTPKYHNSPPPPPPHDADSSSSTEQENKVKRMKEEEQRVQQDMLALRIPILDIQQVFRSRQTSAAKILVMSSSPPPLLPFSSSLSPSSVSYSSFYSSCYSHAMTEKEGEHFHPHNHNHHHCSTTSLNNSSTSSFRCSRFAFLITFPSVPHREQFLEDIMNKAHQEGSLRGSLSSSLLPPPLSSSSSSRLPLRATTTTTTTGGGEGRGGAGFTTKPQLNPEGDSRNVPSTSARSSTITSASHEKKTKREGEVEEEGDSENTSSSLLPVALSHFFNDALSTSSSFSPRHHCTHNQPAPPPSGGRGGCGSYLRGVSEVSTNVLESLLIDPQTWDLRPLTEAVESDILRQIPRLAVLYQRFVRAEDNEEDEGEDGEKGEGEEKRRKNHLGSSFSPSSCRSYSRRDFWTAVARQYFCLAHTFLEEEEEEEEEEGVEKERQEQELKEGTKKRQEQKARGHLPGAAASPVPPSPPPPLSYDYVQDRILLHPPSSRQGVGVGGALLSIHPLAEEIERLNQTSWQALPKRRHNEEEEVVEENPLFSSPITASASPRGKGASPFRSSSSEGLKKEEAGRRREGEELEDLHTEVLPFSGITGPAPTTTTTPFPPPQYVLEERRARKRVGGLVQHLQYVKTEEEREEEAVHQRLLDIAEEEERFQEAAKWLENGGGEETGEGARRKATITTTTAAQKKLVPEEMEREGVAETAPDERKGENERDVPSPPPSLPPSSSPPPERCRIWMKDVSEVREEEECREMRKKKGIGEVVCPAAAIQFYGHPLAEYFTARRPLPQLFF